MIFSFTLSMPGRNSWNGRWSGEDKLFVIVKSFRKKPEKLKFTEGLYTYNFGDGWHAGVEVKQITPAEAQKLRKKSNGFRGYEWMVNSIILDGEIYGPMNEKPDARRMDN